ncbi:hypothetical protein NE237_031718 [Protea cynaroides]|uniref:Protein FAR1-RELATED SEQUENCE n=1 Tax=Protea cynaroides TaxID=273540 RepID=A0A9Q0L2N3_9MAGN|nr:hypothetical protein NE237_031718 [Protea cynaroides]
MARETLAEALQSSVVLDDGIGDRSSSSDAVSFDPSLYRNVSLSHLNAEAPEFVPRTTNRVDLQQQPPPRLVVPHGPGPMHVFASPNSPFHVQMHNHVPLQNHVQYQYYGGFGEQESLPSHSPRPDPVPVTRNGLSEEVTQKILNQVEYYFSDANLATIDHLMRFINKDAEGFVPISVVAFFKKIKALISSHQQLSLVLRTSSKLVVSEDGKKVRRLHPLTESDMENLQSRVVIAENLPEDHSYQNLLKIFFGAVSVDRTRPFFFFIRSGFGKGLPCTTCLKMEMTRMDIAQEFDESLFSERNSEDIDGTEEGNIDEDVIVGNDVPDIYIGQSFNSCEEALSAYKLYAKMHGYSVRIQRSVRRVGKDGKLYRMDFVCHRSGAPGKKTLVDVVNDKRNRKSCRCHCKAHMKVAFVNRNGVLLWHVVAFSDIHNHELLNQNEVRNLRAYRVISQHCKDRLLALEASKVSIRQMLTILAQEQNVPVGCLPFNAKDVHNFLSVVKNPRRKLEASNAKDVHNVVSVVKNPRRKHDATDLVIMCMRLKEKDPGFQFEYEVDEQNRLKHIAWSHATSVHAYHNYGDVVLFDTTYKLDSYDMLVGIWVGVNNFGSTCFFGCCLLRDENIPSFEWAFNGFLKFMNGKAPKSILTDQDLSVKDAICTVFPHTKHALCMWHIAKKFPSHIRPVLKSRYNDWKNSFWNLNRVETVEEFEVGWHSMLEEYGLTTNQYMMDLFEERARWAKPYIRPFFFAGMTTTGRSESMKAFIKRFMTKQVNVPEFLVQVTRSVSVLDYTGETLVTKQKVDNVAPRTNTPIELHAAEVLTPYAFAKYQKEIEASLSYACFIREGSPGLWLVRHMKEENGGRKVSHMPGESTIQCSCQMFEFEGILCRHAVAVLFRCNAFQTPEQFLLFRWRFEASVPLPPILGEVTQSRGRTETVQALALELIREAEKSASSYYIVKEALTKSLVEVRNSGAEANIRCIGSGAETNARCIGSGAEANVRCIGSRDEANARCIGSGQPETSGLPSFL